MNNHDYKQNFANAARVAVALCALAALGGQAVHAQTASQITMPSQLGAFTFTTPNYQGMDGTTVPSPIVTAAGLTTVTLTDQNGTVFSRLDVNNSGLNYPNGTTLIQTADGNNNSLGPLQIDFNTGSPLVGVAGFGVTVQAFAFSQETFTLQVFTNGSTTPDPLNTFTFGPFDNTTAANNGNGTAVFVGALGNTGNTITRAVISESSTINGQPLRFSNNFFASPVTITNAPPAVPEASTVVSFGMGVLLFAGMAVGTRRRKVNHASRSVA